MEERLVVIICGGMRKENISQECRPTSPCCSYQGSQRITPLLWHQVSQMLRIFECVVGQHPGNQGFFATQNEVDVFSADEAMLEVFDGGLGAVRDGQVVATREGRQTC